MDSASFGDCQSALELLSEAVSLSEDFDLRMISLNNMACVFRRQEMFERALSVLLKALDLEDWVTDSLRNATTHLNTGAVYSSINEPEKSLYHAFKAVSILKNTHLNHEKAVVIVIAYCNIAEEYQLLKDFEESNRFFYMAWEYAVQYLGRSHELTRMALESCEIVAPRAKDRIQIKVTSTASTKKNAWRSGVSKNSPTELRYKPKFNSYTLNDTRNRVKIRSKPQLPEIKLKYKLNSRRNNIMHRIQNPDRKLDTREHLEFFSARRQRAALVIQKIYKGYLARKFRGEIVKSAIIIQHFYRRILANKIYRTSLKSKLKQIRLIQTAFRAHGARKLTRLVESCVCLQKWMKGYHCRESARNCISSIKIQKKFRAWLKFKKVRKQLICMKIQSAFKRWIICKMVHKDMLVRKIQTVFKGHLYRQIWLERLKNLSVLQKKMKQFLYKSHFLSILLKKSDSSSIIQKSYRGHLGRKRFRNYKAIVSEKSVSIQSAIRLKICTEYAREVREIKTISQLVISKFTKSYMQRNNYLAFKTKMTNHTINIQKAFRKHEMAIFYQEKHQTYTKACIRIQPNYRGFIGRRIYFNYMAQMSSSSLIIQKSIRRFINLSEFEIFKNKRVSSALKIQGFYRDRKLIENCKLKKENLLSSVKCIQKLGRKTISLENTWHLRNKIFKSSLVIQNKFKEFCTRMFFVQYKENTIRNTLKVQSAFRKCLVLWGFKTKQFYILTAIINIQSAYKKYRASKYFISLKRSALIIQKFYRGFKSRKQTIEVKRFIEYTDGLIPPVITVKMPYTQNIERKKKLQRSFESIKKIQRPFTNRQISKIVKIQKQFRMYLVRIHIRNRIKINRASGNSPSIIDNTDHALRIQSTFRKFMAHLILKKQRALFILKNQFRQFILLKRYKKERSILKIQSSFRQYMHKKSISFYKSVLRIEMSFRMFDSKMLMKRLISQERDRIGKSVLVIQKCFKRLKEKALLNKIKRSVLFIQDFYKFKFLRSSTSLKGISFIKI